ncbi:MAG: phosphoglucosamine mutase [Holosporales bacterium]
MQKFFGTDGVRGRANVHPMTPEMAMRLAAAAGQMWRRPGHQSRVIIGKDTRLSGYMFEPALTAGFISAGFDVILLGPLPTPAVSMLVRSMRADLGVMISASHNPAEDNGIKLFDATGSKLSDAQEQQLAAIVQNGQPLAGVDAAHLGRAKRVEDAPGRYVEFVKATFPKGMNLEGLRIVVDCAHGAAYKVAPLVFWELGAEVLTLGVQPDGSNINRGVGATDVAALRQEVLHTRADLGIALDGDADRVVLVDEQGELIDGDQILGLIAKAWQAQNRLGAPSIVGTVMSNLGLERHLQSLNLNLERAAVGDRFVAARMREKGANVGGEPSGHIIFSDYAGTGDGLIAALQVLSELVRLNRPVSEVAHCFERVPQILKNVHVHGAEALQDQSVLHVLEKAEKRLRGAGRLLVRPSGTEPLIRIMVEGDDKELLTSIADDIAEALLKHGRA